MSPLLELPKEIIQDIAYLLPTDADRLRFALTCRSISSQTLPPESAIWRRLFRDIYDDRRERSYAGYKYDYQFRRRVLSEWVDFRCGEGEGPNYWLDLIKRMIVESLTPDGLHRPMRYKSLQRIREVLVRNPQFLIRPVVGYILDNPRPPSNLFCSVQLLLTYMILDPDVSVVGCQRTDYDMGTVYAFNNELATALQGNSGETSTVQVLLHIRNFWLRHLLDLSEGTFTVSYIALPPSLKPTSPETLENRPWELRTSWLGYDSCLCPYPVTREEFLFEARQSCADCIGHMREITHMTIQIELSADSSNWPYLFQNQVFDIRVTPEHQYFRGTMKYHGLDDSCNEHPVRGFVEPLRGSRSELGELCRICFVNYRANRPMIPLLSSDEADGSPWLSEEVWPPSDLETDFHWIFGYQGVVIPGGKMIFGHWLDVMDMQEAGPFIL